MQSVPAHGSSAADSAGGAFSYREVGATRLGPLPDGYHHLHHRTRVGRGLADYDAAGAALTTWRLHRRAARAYGPAHHGRSPAPPWRSRSARARCG